MLKYNELHFATVANRNPMQRPEGLDTGSIILTGLNKDTIINSIKLVLYEKEIGINKEVSNDYRVRNTALRVTKLITGTAFVSNSWDSVYKGVKN